MKSITQELLVTIEADQISKYLEDYADHGYSYGDLGAKQIAEDYNYSKHILNTSIENGTFDNLSWSTRNTILTSHKNALGAYTHVPSFFQYIDILNEQVVSSGLLALQVEGKDYQSEFNKLVDAQNRILAKEAFFLKKEEEMHQLSDKYENALSEMSMITLKEQEANTKLEEIKKIHELINSDNTEASNLLVSIKESVRESEARRVVIETFYNTIDDYKRSITDTNQIVIDITEKEETINNLILSAETALNMKSAQGVSAAFSTQYTESLKGKNWWLLAAGVFLLASCGATVWILTGWGITNPNEITSLLGRIVAVGILIAGATFCASQFQKQTSIAEDYAYKAVLSKSILAFTDEIKKRNDGQVADYITKVLSEIHKDPQRNRSTKSSASNKFNANSIVEKLIEKIPGGEK